MIAMKKLQIVNKFSFKSCWKCLQNYKKIIKNKSLNSDIENIKMSKKYALKLLNCLFKRDCQNDNRCIIGH